MRIWLVGLVLLVGFVAWTQTIVQVYAAGGEVTLRLRNERTARTRITVMTREGAVLSRRRLDVLGSETVKIRVGLNSTGLRVAAHDEGFNRFLDEDYLVQARPGEVYSVTVTVMDMVAILPYRERQPSDGTTVKPLRLMQASRQQ